LRAFGANPPLYALHPDCAAVRPGYEASVGGAIAKLGKTRIMTDLRPRIEPQDIPPELDRWNWGAFLLNWIWGVGNNTYIALLTFIPFVGIIVMPFMLGAKGSRRAWRNGRWTTWSISSESSVCGRSGARSSGVRYDPNAAAANSGTVIMPPATPTVSWLRSQQLLRVH
jgi:hypothetical protein